VTLPAIPRRARRACALVSLLTAAAGCANLAAGPRDVAVVATSAADPRIAAPALACPKPAGVTAAATVAAPGGSPGARQGAQRGLGFVAREAEDWQSRNKCYGCHVQAVTLEALSIGRHNQYDVSASDMAAVLRGLTELPGGSRGERGLSVAGRSDLIETSKEFGGAAFARYDALVGADVREDLLQVAAQLTEYQEADGSMRTSDQRFPVETGPMQSTTQAMQTWRQAYERSADERWLAPLRRAEAYLQARALKLSDEPSAGIVDLNYAAIGLVSAGAQGGEGVMRSIADRLRKLQHEDGSWGFHAGANDAATAFATGQTLYALRLLGASDADGGVQRGTSWLLAHQGEDGGWSHDGRGKAEAMWAVLGLVSVDVLSLRVAGVEDGQHVQGTVTLRARAADNAGRGVERVEVSIDDVAVRRACGDAAEVAIDADRLEPGRHLVDVTATNARGQQSRRRLELYTGAYYLTQLATRFSDGGTLVSLRDVAPGTGHGEVVLKVFATRDEHGQQVRGEEVWRSARPSAEGPISFFWKGTRDDGKPVPAHGRYLAEVSFVDEHQKSVQSVEVPFVHDTPEAQKARFGEVEGALDVGNGVAAANTKVELVDGQGRVVQSTTTTGAGNYRFRNVDGGKYKVRVSKKGFKAAEADVSARPTAASPAPKVSLEAL
jgi:squalene-hopene/tetraprenyl-beta-curcumene cyclase